MLNQRQVDAMRATYSDMSDEELAYIVATKIESLTEEAKVALSEAIRTRGSRSFAEEVKATKADLEQQAQHAKLQNEKREREERVVRRITFVMSGGLLIAGLLVALFSDARGFAISAVGVAIFALYWVRRLFWRFICAVFRAD